MLQDKLIQSIVEEDISSIKGIINQGANLNMVDTYGRLPILQAIEIENLEIIQLLLQNGADINQRGYEGCTALHIAIGVSMSDTSSPYGIGEEPLEIIKYLLEAGAKVNTKNDKGETPLEWAKKFHSNRTITLLEFFS